MSHHMLDDLLSYDQEHRNIMLVGVVSLFIVIFFVFILHVFATRCIFNSISAANDPNKTFDPNANNHHRRNTARSKGLLLGLGLHPYAIASSIPVFVYHDDQQDKRPLGCAICLCGFVDGETDRRLPGCGHAFHVDCIDIWLCSSHFTCPICRSLVFLPQQNHPIRPFRKHDDHVSNLIAAVENGSERHTVICNGDK